METGRGGAAAKAGHDLSMEVGFWTATIRNEASDGIAIELTADGGSLRVLEGSGGMKSLDEDDKSGIKQTIDEEVLRRPQINFRSDAVEASSDGAQLKVHGELELAGKQHPTSFELSVGEDDRLTGSATIKQTDWGIKPYSALFGTLKVSDEVVVSIDAKL